MRSMVVRSLHCMRSMVMAITAFQYLHGQCPVLLFIDLLKDKPANQCDETDDSLATAAWRPHGL